MTYTIVFNKNNEIEIKDNSKKSYPKIGSLIRAKHNSTTIYKVVKFIDGQILGEVVESKIYEKGRQNLLQRPFNYEVVE